MLRHLKARRPVDKGIGWPVFLFGAIEFIYVALAGRLLIDGSILLTLSLAATIGPVINAIYNFFYGSYLSWVGSWFGGKANTDQARLALAWSKVPLIWSFLFTFPPIILLINLSKTGVDIHEWETVYSLTILSLEVIWALFGLFSLVLTVVTLAEVHEFSVNKALLTLATGFVIATIPFFCMITLILYN